MLTSTQHSCSDKRITRLPVDFGRNPLALPCLLSSFRARRIQRGLLFDLHPEAIRDFPFLFSLMDYPGEGSPYQLSEPGIRACFPLIKTIRFTCFHQLLLYSLPRLGAALSASVASTDPQLLMQARRASWSQHCDERDVEQRFLCDSRARRKSFPT